jgi:putative Mg2+ transporter-C (MgtC) family protein
VVEGGEGQRRPRRLKDMAPFADLDGTAMAIRLGTAMLAGAIIGIDREINRKPAGMRTHALVSIGAAIVVLAVIATSRGDDQALSRAYAGIITGIGFLGAGVILRHEAENRIEGLTTAATIWVAAALGSACGAGLIELVGIALGAILLVLAGGNPVESAIKRRFGRPGDPDRDSKPDGP